MRQGLNAAFVGLLGHASCRGITAAAFTRERNEILNVVIITGTTRTDGPPRPILGPRVATFVERELKQRGHEVHIVDPRELIDDVPLMTKPHFSYRESALPESLRQLHLTLKNADAYVAITPEYNHAPSPGLLNILNHFGSSTFAFKPSAIVSYSAGQWGGTRAAHSLRPVLSELGCLPVSAMMHIPKVKDHFGENGEVLGDEEEAERWKKYAQRSLSQLEWWGEAAKQQKKLKDPFDESPPFASNPSQRNAP